MGLKKEILENLQKETEKCKKCKLARTRTKVVFGEGDCNAKVMFIGEGPGRQEDLTGRPFVGRAGELLTRIIEKGMGIPRLSVYIANLVKCRPSVDLKMQRDRPPDDAELESCTPYLFRQIEQMDVFLLLGILIPYNELGLYCSSRQPRKSALDSCEQPILQPVFCIAALNSNNENPTLILQQPGATQPGVEGGLSHL